MSQDGVKKTTSLGNLVGTKDLLKMVVGKLSSQLLLFSMAIIVFLIVSFFLFSNEGFWITIAILFVFVSASAGYLFVEQKKKLEAGDPEAVQQHLSSKIGEISNPSAPFNIELWTGKNISGKTSASSRDIAAVPKQKESDAAYHVGDKIVIHFRASRDCYLTLLNIGTSGKLTILFPNSTYPDNHIASDKLYKIPGPEYGFDYKLQGPSGIEKLKAIATLKNISLVESDFTPDGTLFRTSEGGAASRDIAMVAQKLAPVATEEWSEATYQVEVLD